MAKDFFVGDLVTPELPARVWNEEIIETIGSFRYGEFAVVIDACEERREYARVVTARGRIGWVLRTLIRAV